MANDDVIIVSVVPALRRCWVIDVVGEAMAPPAPGMLRGTIRGLPGIMLAEVARDQVRA